jgi:hypothetical protein
MKKENIICVFYIKNTDYEKEQKNEEFELKRKNFFLFFNYFIDAAFDKASLIFPTR